MTTLNSSADAPPAPERPKAAPTNAAPDYKLVGILGKGGMSETHRATVGPDHTHTVAFKEVLPELVAADDERRHEFLERFFLEARLGAQFNHPNIVRVHDSGHFEERPYMAMEFVDGVSLATLISWLDYTQNRLAPHTLFYLACELADALHYAHSHNVTHRDVKPGNALLSVAGECKLSDFGIATARHEMLDLTADGTFMGTLSHAPPEAVRAEHLPQGDLYSLALTIVEAAIARTLFPGKTLLEVSEMRRSRDPIALLREARDDLPEAFVAQLSRLLDPDPMVRGTASEALTTFEQLLGRHSSAAEQELISFVTQARDAASPAPGGRDQTRVLDPLVPDVNPNPSTRTVIVENESFLLAVYNRLFPSASIDNATKDDLLAEGRLALLLAHRAYEGRKYGAGFQTYAYARVNGAMLDYLPKLEGLYRGAVRNARREADAIRKELERAGGESAGGETGALLRHARDAAGAAVVADPFTEITKGLTKRTVRETVARFPFPQQREVIRLYHFEEKSYAEIAKTLELSKTRVANVHAAGLHTLRLLFIAGSSLEPEHLRRCLPALSTPHRRALRGLYLTQDSPDDVRRALRLASVKRLEVLHAEALEALSALQNLTD